MAGDKFSAGKYSELAHAKLRRHYLHHCIKNVEIDHDQHGGEACGLDILDRS